MAFACAIILLAACGGGGGGGGAAAFKLRVAVTNEAPEAASVSLDVAGAPGEPQTVESCKGAALTFDLPEGEDWTLAVNGEPAIDSLQIDPNLIDKNLIAEVWIHADGTVEQKSINPGALIGPPAASGICL
jgi:hypothetical protein